MHTGTYSSTSETNTSNMTSTANEEYIKKNRVVVIDDDRNTKLHYAAAAGDLEALKAEIVTGHKLDPENYLGWTPLMMAVRNGQVDVVNILLDNKADATKKNRYGMSIFLISVTCGNLKLVTKLLSHLLCGGVSRQHLQRTVSPLSLTLLFGHMHIFKYLLEQSFDVNAATPLTGITPMMFAAAMRNNKAIKRLLAKNADMSLKNYLGRTAQDIITLRQTTSNIDYMDNQPKVNCPLLVVSSCNPSLQLLPYPVGKSSAGETAGLQVPTNTPMSAMMPQQMFFPADFSPSQFLNPLMARVGGASGELTVNATKSSNVETPSPNLHTPNFSPISPMMVFPPDYAAGQYLSPMGTPLYATNEMLNHTAYFSPYVVTPSPQNSPLVQPVAFTHYG